MQSDTKRPVYLSIRSLGDFVVAASFIKRFALEKIPVVLPDYLVDLFWAMQCDEHFEIVGKISYNNQPAFFELYKLKNIKAVKKLMKDYWFFIKNIDRSLTYILDERSRRISFPFLKFIWPPADQNRYFSKPKTFEQHYNFSGSTYDLNSFKKPSGERVIIFPDSRVADKEIEGGLVNDIVAQFPSGSTFVAKFSKDKISDGLNLYYANFQELIGLINSSSFVISADSLPYHLAFYYDKPHFVIYKAKSKFYTEHFKTPYMIANNSFSLVDNDNFADALSRLIQILK